MRQSCDTLPVEIIICDDQSGDGTWEVLSEKQKQHDNLKTIALKQTSGHPTSPKKAGITRAVHLAKGDVILVTDGDCRMGPDWIRKMTEPFTDDTIHFVSGPVQIVGTNSLWHRWQMLEFASLVVSGAALIGWDHPVICNGANMAFRKSAFLDSKGYQEDRSVISGDDVFLMQGIHNNSGGVRFVKHEKALVTTPAQSQLRSFVLQRLRWAGKWNHYRSWYALMLGPGIFLYYLLLLMCFIQAAIGSFPTWLLLVILLLKVAAEYELLSRIYILYKEKIHWGLLVLSSVFYTIYAVIFGVLSNFLGYSWKGRTYKKYNNE
jgi:cellulose synthase/poly-beta-1,6-N-acetylglucosamine synthase-like glycosyltransferase